MTVYQILEQLAVTSSRLDKEAILKANQKNDDLKETIRLALDNMTQFYIRKIPSYQKGSGDKSLSWAFESLKKLSTRQATGNAGIDHLTYILESVQGDNCLVIERIIAKDLRCGVSTATANKIWKNLIPEFPVMLASGFDGKLLEAIKWPAIAQLKLDGMRAAIIIKDKTVSVFSRNGKPIELGNHFDHLISLFPEDTVLDGELLVLTPEGGFMNRQTGNGILNKAVKGTISQKEITQVHVVLFDMIPYKDFVRGVYKVPYTDRIRALSQFEQSHSEQGNHAHKLSIVATRSVESLEKTKSFFDEVFADGEEGIILKDSASIWEGKRSKKQIKFKGELDCDLVCVGWEYGTGKNLKRLGNLLLESNDGIVKVSVGSGFSDEQRDEFRDNVVGKIVAVRYNARIKDRSGQESLFLPRFLEVREDKDTADSAKDIK